MDGITVPKQVLDWLFKVLQGHYIEPKTTFHDVVYVLNSMTWLRPRTRVFTYPNGSSALLLCLYGKVHDIPVILWIPREYPSLPCMIFIDLELLPSTMQLRVNQNIDSSGRVYLPILAQWREKARPLLAIVKDLSTFLQNASLFSECSDANQIPLPPKPWDKPSVYSAENNLHSLDSRLDTVPNFKSEESSGHVASLSQNIPPPIPARPFKVESLSSTGTHETKPPVPDRPSPKTQLGTLSSQQLNSPCEKSQESTKALNEHGDAVGTNLSTNLMDISLDTTSDLLHSQLLVGLKEKLIQLSARDAKEIESYVAVLRFDAESILSRLNSLLSYEMNILDKMETEIESNSLLLTDEIKLVEKELWKASVFKGDLDPIDVAVPETTAFVQLYELTARDKALTDAIDIIAQLFHKNKLSSNCMVKKVRELSLEQFRVRYLISKITNLLE